MTLPGWILLSPLLVFITAVTVLLGGRRVQQYLIHRRRGIEARKARALGCGALRFEPSVWPLGFDKVLAGLKADREQGTLDFITGRFRVMGCYTFGAPILGRKIVVTADPDNMKALLSTQFDDFPMNDIRNTIFRPITGRSIFAVDGAAWHAARSIVRPLFTGEMKTDLDRLEAHVQLLLACIEGLDAGPVDEGAWTPPVGLAGLFDRLTLDTSTERFLGHNTHSLRARLRGERQTSRDFHWAFNRMQQIVSVRLRVRWLYWLFGRSELREATATLNRFVDEAMARSDEADDPNTLPESVLASGRSLGAGNTRSRGSQTKQKTDDFLGALRERCSDPAEVREHVLGLLVAGRDTTGALLAWVFYRLIRSPRVWQKLREAVLEDFGPSADRGAIAADRLRCCRYLQAVLSETLRLHSIVALNGRLARRDTTLPKGGGPAGDEPVFVRAGTEISFCTHVLHRRRDLWGDDADDFVPERWIGGARRPPPWAYLPFHAGPRTCLGQQLALTDAGYVVVRMLQRYEAVEGLDVNRGGREFVNFTIMAKPGTGVKGEEAVRARFKIARY